MLAKAPKENDSSITKLNQVILLVKKKRLTGKFFEGDYETEIAQVPENDNSSDQESDTKISDIFSSEDSCDEKCFIQKHPARCVLQK